MNKEALKTEVLLQAQNVQCGAKLAAEIHYVYKETEFAPEDVILLDGILKHFPDLKCLISYHPEKEYANQGHKSIYLFKYPKVVELINEISKIQNKDSVLYHFTSGKLFGYNDFEVMKFIEKNCNGTNSK